MTRVIVDVAESDESSDHQQIGRLDPYRFDSAETASLRRLVMNWRDLQGMRKAFQQREADDNLVEALRKLEDQSHRAVGKALRQHPVWPWLSEKKGLAGPSTALVISAIGNPLRFPGQRCSEGHYLPVGLFGVDEPCPYGADFVSGSDGEAGTYFDADRRYDTFDSYDHIESDTSSGVIKNGAAEYVFESDSTHGCPGVVLPPRPGTGVRSIWHYLGLHAIELPDGRTVSPRLQKGHRCDWHPLARSMVLMPDVGLAAQIVKHRPDPYRTIYDDQKERLIAERPDAKLIAVDRIAQKIAVKAFIGDLFIAWKTLAADPSCESDRRAGCHPYPRTTSRHVAAQHSRRDRVAQ